MPNWCYNEIEVHDASGKFCQRLLELPKDAELFNSFLPSENYYDDWGTRDVSVEQLLLIHLLSENSAYFQGDTAWSPPIEFFEAMSKEYGITVKMYYEEPLMDFAGETFIENGERRENNYNYDSGLYFIKGFDDWLFSVDLEDVTEEDVRHQYPYLQEEEIQIVLQKLVQV